MLRRGVNGQQPRRNNMNETQDVLRVQKATNGWVVYVQTTKGRVPDMHVATDEVALGILVQQLAQNLMY